jgi:hypothetical protein
VRASNIFFIVFVSNSLILPFKYSLSFVADMSGTSRLVLFKVSTLIWLPSRTYCNLACNILSGYLEKSESNLGLCSFRSY